GVSILLCASPRVLERLEPGRFDLVLAGHMHDGQIALPYPGGKVRFGDPSADFTVGIYRSRAATMHVSAGLGTTFVPFRFAARPEATKLTLIQGSPRHTSPVRRRSRPRPSPATQSRRRGRWKECGSVRTASCRRGTLPAF